MNGIYARQSLDKKDSLSIDTQIEICKAEVNNEACAVYIDKGFSGKNTNRPQFQTLMGDVQAGKIEKIIVYKLDRLSRSLLDFATMIDAFNKYGVTFVSTREKFDTSTPIGNAMLSIIMVFAQLERETIQLRVKDAYHARSARGAYDGLAPYGYRKCKDYSTGKAICTIEPDPVTAPILLSIYEMYGCSPLSLGKIARDLNMRGIPSPSGVKWDSGKLSRIMANPINVRADIDVYVYYKKLGANITNQADDFLGENGCVTYGQWDRKRRKFDQMGSISLSIGLHEGIVPSSLFLRVLEKLNDNMQVNNARRGKYSWLTGFIKCGYCGHALVVKKGAQNVLRFECSGKTNYGACGDYTGNQCVWEMERAVEKEIFKAIRSKKALTPSKQSDEPSFIAKKHKVEITKINEKIGRLVDAIAQGSADSISTLMNRIALLESEKRGIEEKLRESMQQQDGEKITLESIITQWAGMGVDHKREFAKAMIRQVTVRNDKLQISWKYDFQEAENNASNPN